MLNKSFTLVETIVAITVLTTGILAVSSLISYSLSSASFVRQKLIAAYLAQEGIEIVRNIKDKNILEIMNGVGERKWDDNLACQGGCSRFDYRSQVLPDQTCTGEYLSVVDGLYQCTSTSPIKLKRTVTVTTTDNTAMEVTVEVSWKTRGREHSVKAQEVFYNYWLPQ